MRHLSVPSNQSCEFINVQSISPLISKCQIKVCYVSEDPNRNKSILTKEVATNMAGSLRGCPIVGKYNTTKKDFEEHNKILKFENGKWSFDTDTRPYGFVDVNAKVWFQKFIDDNSVEREYLVTEGYIWTGQFPEAQRCVTQGNNQSMELDPETLQGEWTKDENLEPQFFIINDGLFSKLCILGDDEEPCFEGSQINVHFSLDENDEFKNTFYSMMNELKTVLNKGGKDVDNVITTFAVEIGDGLWSALYNVLETQYPDNSADYNRSIYCIRGIYEEGTQKFTIVQERTSDKLFRFNFTYDENGLVLAEPVEVEIEFVEVNGTQFTLEDNENFAKSADKNKKPENDETEETVEEEEKIDEEEEEDETKKKTSYSLDDIPEYQELLANYSTLQKDYEALEIRNNELISEIAPLTEFKNKVELKEKEDMINSFYMLEDEDKADVRENINTYSLNEIESKLAVICVKKKVDFSLNEEGHKEDQPSTTFNVDNTVGGNECIPQWLQAVEQTQKELQ